MAGRPNGRAAKRNPKDLKRGLKKKPCQFCRDKTAWIDYKDLGTLRKFMSDRGKIRARRVTGNCEQHQHDVAEAIKTARELVLLPYTQRTMTERPARRDRGERGERPDRGPRRDDRDEAAADTEGTTEGDEVVEVEVVDEVIEVVEEEV